jgi:hypothetical protein
MEEPRNRQFNMEDPKTNRATGAALAIFFAVILLVVVGFYILNVLFDIF